MARLARLLACFLISTLALVSVAYRVTWDDLLAAFFRYSGVSLLVLFGYTLLIRMPPSLRLQRLLPITFALALRTVLLGCGLNNILPGRAGEIGRAHFLLREARITIPRAVRAIFWERLFDVNMLLLISCLAALFFHPGANPASPPDANRAATADAPALPPIGPMPPPAGERQATEPSQAPAAKHTTPAIDAQGSDADAPEGTVSRPGGSIPFFRIPFLLGVLGIWVVLGLMYRYPVLGRRAVGLIPFRTLRLARSLRLFGYRFLAHVRTDMTPRLVSGLTLTTLLIWAGYLGTTWITIRLVTEIPVPAAAILLVFAASHLTYVMPAAPGSIGLYEWAWVYALGVFDVPAADALAAGLTCHMMQYIPMTIFSIAILTRSQMGLHLRELSESTTAAFPDAEAKKQEATEGAREAPAPQANRGSLWVATSGGGVARKTAHPPLPNTGHRIK